MVGDIHGNRPYFKHVANMATRVETDVILQVGDLGFWPHTDPEFVPRINRDMKAADSARRSKGLDPLWMLWIDGNHENFDALYDTEWERTEQGFWKIAERVLYAPRGHRWIWGGVRFLALGGGTSIDKEWRLSHGPVGLYWWPQEAITQRDVYNAIEGGATDILVSHDIPQGSKLPFALYKAGVEHDQNRMAVRAVVDAVKPARVYHGHYHVRHDGRIDGDGYVAEVVGLDRDGSYGANYVVLDLDEFKQEHARRFV